MKKAKRIKLNDRTSENDIKYKGVLSYRHIRIIGWLCLIVSQVSTILALAGNIDPGFKQSAQTAITVLSVFGSLPIPLFLLANFSNILRNKENWRSLFILYGGGALGMYLLGNFVVFHYGYRFINAFINTATWGDAATLFGALLPALGKTGYTFNIFIDMLMCTLLFFFMNYNPKKVFTGKNVIWFRLLFILPVAYEVAGIVIKFLLGINRITIPSYVFFLLPSKPPLIFLAFVIIVLALKIGEIKFKKRHNGSEEEYQNHVATNAHSLKVSIIISIIFAIMAFLDVIVTIGIVLESLFYAQAATTVEEEMQLIAMTRINAWSGAGFGGAFSLLLIIPLVLLFSYNKTHKNTKIDTLLPIAGIGLIALLYLEGIFQVIIINAPLVIERLKNWLSSLLGGGEETPEGGETARTIAQKASDLIEMIRPK